MTVRRCDFVCSCGRPASFSYTNYYRQLRLWGIVSCPECTARRKSQNLSDAATAKYDKVGRNRDRVIVSCACGTQREISVRQRKANTVCPGCAARVSRAAHHETYAALAAARRGNIHFADAVGRGVREHMTEGWRVNISLAQRALWADPEYRSRLMQLRHTDQYRAAMRAIWERPGYKDNHLAVTLRQRYRTSRPQTWLQEILDDLGVRYETEYALGPYRFDVYLPDHRRLIEVQGDYWHSLPRAVANDRAKATYATRYFPEHKLCYVYEHEFYCKDRVRSRLSSELGLDSIPVIPFDFNEVELREAPASAVNDFMYKYHYIGPRPGAINLAYYIGDTLVACCSYSSPTRAETAIRLRADSTTVRDLSRFCIHPRYQRKNFASWCIARSIRWIRRHRPAWRILVAFADSALGHAGTIYRAGNWRYDGDTDVSYYYVSRDGFVMHKKTLYNRASKMGLAEREFAESYGYERKWTGVKHRFVYLLSR